MQPCPRTSVPIELSSMRTGVLPGFVVLDTLIPLKPFPEMTFPEIVAPAVPETWIPLKRLPKL